MPALRRSPLDDRHRALGAHLVEFAGWDMPLDYGSVVAEHTAVRTSCGAFDLSHLGTLVVTGADAVAAVQATFTNDAAALEVGRAHYTLCLDEAGGIVDDLLVYRLDWGCFVVPNAANAAAVRAALAEVAAGMDAVVTDVKDDLACIAVQGRSAAEVAQAAGLDVAGMRYLDCRGLGAAPSAGVLARSGYTGEPGYEAFVPAAGAGALWDRLVGGADGAVPAGLGSRDTLRLEMGYPLHGNDISLATSPVEAGLTWAVAAGTGFRGEEAYAAARAAGPARRLRGLQVRGRGIPRAGCSVEVDGREVGVVTSGTFSPTLRGGIAMGYLDSGIGLGDQVTIVVRGKMLPGEVVRPPFVATSPKN